MILPLLPLKGTVVFPQSTVPLAIGHERSLRLVDDVASADRLLVLTATRDRAPADPDWHDVYEIGTLARLRKLLRLPDGTLRILVEGIARVRLERALRVAPYLVGDFAALPDHAAKELARVADLQLLNVGECQRVLEETNPERRLQLVAAIVRREVECARLLQPAARATAYAASELPLTAPV
ncbi:MAG TPA: LON peptidase substrate-binding domain-containing protein [Gaiellaceae bacterium]|nr:LON peptidase substrate-binding domain-containing protein [Gaiellaceae bacterium]